MSLSWNTGDVWRAALLGLAYSLGLGIPFLIVALGLGWATRSLAFMRRHVRTVNIIGGSLLILVGALMVSGVWGIFMSRMQGVIGSVNLPI
jgi:cytochrome c-type biogenesis protein